MLWTIINNNTPHRQIIWLQILKRIETLKVENNFTHNVF